MKNRKKHLKIMLLLLVGIACQEAYFNEVEPTGQRIIGSEAGAIDFEVYGLETEVVASLQFEEGTLLGDKKIIPNLYYFNNDVITNDFQDSVILIEDLIKGREQMSRKSAWFDGNNRTFIYFIPIDHLSGYAQDNEKDLELHYVVDFLHPVTLEFAIWTETKLLIEDITEEGPQPYKIRIPRNEDVTPDGWCCTIYLKWNEEGYISGYDDVDLTYLINGQWREETGYGTGEKTITHWEKVPNFEFSDVLDSVKVVTPENEGRTFYKQMVRIEMDNFDYLYGFGQINEPNG